MENYIEVVFHSISKEQSDILVAKLADAGYEGFEETGNELKAFIPKNAYDNCLIKNLIPDHDIHFTQYEVNQQNWNDLWESNFQPVIVNDFAAVRAEFHEPIHSVKHEIIITPKMSFGTGHHATTRMMMQQMSEIDFNGKSVFDFGTGTGILAILAEKLGAGKVLAIDNDDWSIENAKENIERNGCKAIQLEKADTADQQRQFDIILANIIKHVLIDNMGFLADQLGANGVLILSGLLPEDEADILDCAKKRLLIVDKKLQENNWVSLRFIY